MKLRHIKSLTGIRFLAAMWVVLYHFKHELKELLPILNPVQWLVAKGVLAVPFFFILSGFILSYNYFSRYELGRHYEFIWLRFSRLWPVHLATIIMFYSCFLFAHFIGVSLNRIEWNPTFLWLELPMIRGWFEDELLMNKPAWSIQAEWFAYIFIFPVCYLVLARSKSILLNILIPLSFLLVDGIVSFDMIPGKSMDILFLFIAGSSIYKLRSLVANIPNPGLLTSFTVVGLIALLYFDLSILNPLIFVFFGCLIFFLSFESGIVNAILSVKPIVYGGLISYSLYMTHYFLMFINNSIYARMPHNDYLFKALYGTALIAVAISLASVFYHFVEEPSNRMLRKFLKNSI